ncbi:MAG: hypothetical protein WBV90_02020 [Terrimicrobiaceae bacterium]
MAHAGSKHLRSRDAALAAAARIADLSAQLGYPPTCGAAMPGPRASTISYAQEPLLRLVAYCAKPGRSWSALQ